MAMNYARVVFIPKFLPVQSIDDLRPIINLLECLHKVFASILCRRLKQKWPVPQQQRGGVPHAQVLECLFAAHCLSAVEVMTGRPSLTSKVPLTICRMRFWKSFCGPARLRPT